MLRLLELIPPLDEYDVLMTGQPIWRAAAGRSARSRPPKLLPAATGPTLRPPASWDLRRTMPYLRYDEVDFDVIVGS